jgi:hypothetical protein
MSKARAMTFRLLVVATGVAMFVVTAAPRTRL